MIATPPGGSRAGWGRTSLSLASIASIELDVFQLRAQFAWGCGWAVFGVAGIEVGFDVFGAEADGAAAVADAMDGEFARIRKLIDQAGRDAKPLGDFGHREQSGCAGVNHDGSAR